MKWIRKNRRYVDLIITLLILIIGILLIWYLFLFKHIVDDLPTIITLILSSFGLLFGIIQFRINNIKQNDNYLRRLRYDEYLKIRELLTRFSEILNSNMMLESNPHLLVNKLVDTKNELSQLLNMNNDFLFLGIKNLNSGKILAKITDDILVLSDKFRKEVDEILKERKETEDWENFIAKIRQMEWHNEVREKLKEFHNSKYSFYKDIQKYLI